VSGEPPEEEPGEDDQSLWARPQPPDRPATESPPGSRPTASALPPTPPGSPPPSAPPTSPPMLPTATPSGSGGWPASSPPPSNDQSQPGDWARPPQVRRVSGWVWGLIGALIGLLAGIVITLFGLFLFDSVFGPSSYGDDPLLDRLWDECEAGDMQSCNDLFNNSPAFSEYEEFGDTCGRRTRGGTDCLDVSQ
jgi:hypothetical protein